MWASGDWRGGRGIRPIEGLEVKLATAIEFGAKMFFVPEMQLEEARRFAATHGETEIAPLAVARSNPREALREYWSRLEVPPGRDASQALRKDIIFVSPMTPAHDGTTPRTFSPMCGKDWLLPMRFLQATHLVTIVSKGFDLVDLALGAVRPKECLLLHNRELVSEAVELEQQDQPATAGTGMQGLSRRVLRRESRRPYPRASLVDCEVHGGTRRTASWST